MKVFSVSILLTMSLLATSVFAQTQEDQVETFDRKVLCSEQAKVELFDQSLKKVLITVDRNEPVKLFQGWDVNEVKANIRGEEKTFAHVQLIDAEGGVDVDGFVDQSIVKDFSKCESAVAEEKAIEAAEEAEALANNMEPLEISGGNYGLSASNIVFPLGKNVTTPYSGGGAGMRQFGYRRDGGRRMHAACDLYQSLGTPIRAVTDGKILRGPYFYYLGTYAMEVKHAGGFVAVYGEMQGRSAKGARGGAKVKRGQTIGYMGKVQARVPSPMLHFELYKGTLSGPIRTRNNRFQRRSDLINPTSYLQKWEDNSL